MVQQKALDRVFASLADPIRRRVLVRLGDGPATVGDLATPAGISLTGMKKHLQVLEDAGLIVTEKVGRSRHCRLAPAPLDEAMTWISFYQRLWARRLDGLDAYLTLQHEAKDPLHDSRLADDAAPAGDTGGGLRRIHRRGAAEDLVQHPAREARHRGDRGGPVGRRETDSGMGGQP
ncbi:helix-turn-helix transcriptional regulator [Salinispora arenicola]|nr:helix-turn-helix transcriptional regulator [Salinispora arenicola]